MKMPTIILEVTLGIDWIFNDWLGEDTTDIFLNGADIYWWSVD